jgi:hypothetical protein
MIATENTARQASTKKSGLALKLQITNKSQIPMSKITNPMTSMHPCIHAEMHPLMTNDRSPKFSQ